MRRTGFRATDMLHSDWDDSLMQALDVKKPAYLPQLDALRGVACLMVLVAHLRAVDGLSWMPDYVGVAGVGIFFALSGFLITRILLADRSAGRGLNEFYTRRVARICPIYYLLIVVLAVVWPGKELIWAATYTFNFLYFADTHQYFSADAVIPPIAHVWSLCVEEHFYWVWPVLVMSLPLRFTRWIPLLVILATPPLALWLATMLQSHGLDAENIDGFLSRVTITQLTAISIGSLAAIYEPWLMSAFDRGRVAISKSMLVGAGLMMLSAAAWALIAILHVDVHGICGRSLLHCLCGGVFLTVLTISFFGRLRWLCRIGAISYGLYLYHLPIYAGFGLAQTEKPITLANGAYALIVTFAVAFISYRVFECPIIAWVRNKDRKIIKLPRLRLSFGAALTLLLVMASTAYLVRSGKRIARLVAATDNTEWSQPDKNAIPPERINTIVTGSSHACVGIATPEISNGYAWNSAYFSQDLWYDCQIVQRDIARMPNLKQAVFVVSVFSFRVAVSDSPREVWRESLYWFGRKIESRRSNCDNRQYGALALIGQVDALQQLRENETLADARQQGWHPSQTCDSRSFDPTLGPIAAKRHDFYDAHAVEENKSLLIKTIKLCQAHGIRCLLVSTPKHECYREALRTALVEETKKNINDVCTATGAVLLDYECDPRFTEPDFWDADHLGKEGAVKFTRILDADIKALSNKRQVAADQKLKPRS